MSLPRGSKAYLNLMSTLNFKGKKLSVNPLPLSQSLYVICRGIAFFHLGQSLIILYRLPCNCKAGACNLWLCDSFDHDSNAGKAELVCLMKPAFLALGPMVLLVSCVALGNAWPLQSHCLFTAETRIAKIVIPSA